MKEPPSFRKLEDEILKITQIAKQRRKEEMTNKVFDSLKWGITVGFPSVAVFVQTLGLNFVLWNANGVEVNVVLLLNAIGVLGATWLGISSIQYKKEQ